VLRDLLLRPVVIFDRADDELDFVSGLQVRKIFQEVARDLAAARAFQIHDAPHARVHGRNVQRAAGFNEHGVAVVAKLLHQRQRGGLEQRFAASEFDERERDKTVAAALINTGLQPGD